jgi:hypothetical protein
MRHLMATVLLLAGSIALIAGPAAAGPVQTFTVVDHGLSHTATFPDDICGPRASTTTFTAKASVTHLTARPDGTFQYHDVAPVTYVSDYEDPALPDLRGRLTEVNSFTFTPGGVFVAVTTYHDFFGNMRIFERVHITEVDGRLVVDRQLIDVSGCP